MSMNYSVQKRMFMINPCCRSFFFAACDCLVRERTELNEPDMLIICIYDLRLRQHST